MSATDVSREWARNNFSADKAWREECDRPRAAQEAAALAKRDARRAKKEAGDGWRVVVTPKVPHADLERLTHHAWDLAFHGIPFPAGWRTRWGELRPPWRAVTIPSAKLILLDERAQRGRTWRAALTTVLHELVHMTHPAEVHGPGFTETLRRVLAYVLPLDEPADAKPTAGPRTPARTEGMTMDDGWEYAMLKTSNGRPVGRPAARASLAQFERAIAANGGHAPTGPDGQPMAWNESRGWFPRSTSPPGRTSLLEAMRRQVQVTQDIVAHGRLARGDTDLSRRLQMERQARLAHERTEVERREQEAVAAYAAASEEAIRFMAMYCAGRARPRHVSLAEAEGAQLALLWPTGPSLTAECARKRLAR